MFASLSAFAENLSKYEMQAQATPEFRICNTRTHKESSAFFIALSRLGDQLIINRKDTSTPNEPSASGEVTPSARKTLNDELTAILKDPATIIIRTSSHVTIRNQADLEAINTFVEEFGAALKPDPDSHCAVLELTANKEHKNVFEDLNSAMTQAKFWDTLGALLQDL